MVVPFHQEIDDGFDKDGCLFPAPPKTIKQTRGNVNRDDDDADAENENHKDEEEEDYPAEDGTNAGFVVDDEINPTMDTVRITHLMKRVTRCGLNLVDRFGVRDWRQI
jgi:hypothetical protein